MMPKAAHHGTPTEEEEVRGQFEEGQGLSTEDGDGFSFDMDDVEADKGFEPLPQGVYSCTIEELEYRISAAGKPMWAAKLAVVGGPGSMNYEEMNRKLFWNQSWAPTMLSRGKATLQKIAPELTKGSFNPKKCADEGILLGRPLRAKVAIKVYNGEKRNEVKDVLAPTLDGASGGFSL
jgi:hypothetical protein